MLFVCVVVCGCCGVVVLSCLFLVAGCSLFGVCLLGVCCGCVLFFDGVVCSLVLVARFSLLWASFVA